MADWQKYRERIAALEGEHQRAVLNDFVDAAETLMNGHDVLDADDGATEATDHAWLAALHSIEAMLEAELRYYEREKPAILEAARLTLEAQDAE